MIIDMDRVFNFMEAAKGLSAHRTARVMTRWGTPGIDWRGSNKRTMAEAYSAGTAYGCSVSEAVIPALQKAERTGLLTVAGRGAR